MNTPKLKKKLQNDYDQINRLHLCLLNSIAVAENRYDFAFETWARLRRVS